MLAFIKNLAASYLCILQTHTALVEDDARGAGVPVAHTSGCRPDRSEAFGRAGSRLRRTMRPAGSPSGRERIVLDPTFQVA